MHRPRSSFFRYLCWGQQRRTMHDRSPWALHCRSRRLSSVQSSPAVNRYLIYEQHIGNTSATFQAYHELHETRNASLVVRNGGKSRWISGETCWIRWLRNTLEDQFLGVTWWQTWVMHLRNVSRRIDCECTQSWEGDHAFEIYLGEIDFKYFWSELKGHTFDGCFEWV